MTETIKVEAKDEKEALKRGSEKFSKKLQRKVGEEELLVELDEGKKGGVFGLFKKSKNVYVVKLKEDTVDEDALDLAEDINLDGEFQIKVVDEGIFLKVIPPEGEGKRVSYEEVENVLNEKKIEEVDQEALQETVREAENEWVEIAPRKPELDEDAEVEVNISSDKLRAYLTYKPALGGEKISYDKLKEILHEAGVIYGIKDDKLKQVIKHREKQKELLIAEGDEPEPGKDGELEYHFEVRDESIGTEREDGSIDFYDRGLITNVNPGDTLVTVKDPVPGKPGKTVTGEEIEPPEPEEAELPSGKNTEKKDEKILVSNIKGQVVKEKKKVNVLPIHEVNGNVDINTGNIDFVGNVYVKGDVEEGFVIKAGGNVEIRGRVSAARIESGGEVVINKGFVGKEKGKIEAEGDVRIKFVENGNVESQKSVIVSDAIMHSRIIAAEDIIVSQNKGLLVGGKCRAGHHIEANIIGSSMATRTILEAGINPECKERIGELEKEINQAEQNLLKTKKALRALQKMKEKQGKLPSNQEIMFQRLKKTKGKIEESIEEKENEMEELKEKLSNVAKGKIKVNKKVFSGVQMVIGNSQYNVHDELRHSSFIEDGGEVRQIPL